jgi:hypothetical protein
MIVFKTITLYANDGESSNAWSHFQACEIVNNFM